MNTTDSKNLEKNIIGQLLSLPACYEVVVDGLKIYADDESRTRWIVEYDKYYEIELVGAFDWLDEAVECFVEKRIELIDENKVEETILEPNISAEELHALFKVGDRVRVKKAYDIPALLGLIGTVFIVDDEHLSYLPEGGSVKVELDGVSENERDYRGAKIWFRPEELEKI